MIAALDLNPFDILISIFSFILATLHSAFSSVGPLRAIGSFGLAIVALTIIMRTLLFPLFAWQLRITKRTQAETAKIQPQLAELRKKYKGQKLNEEVQKVYREHNANPMGMMLGCVPMVIQALLIYPLYFAIRSASKNLRTDLGFLWIPDVTRTTKEACCQIGKTAANGTEHFQGWLSGFAQHPWFLLLPLLAGLATLVQSRMMLTPPPKNATPQMQATQNMGKQMVLLAPVTIFLVGLNFAQGIALYWVTQSTYMIVQQFYLLVIKDYHSLGGDHIPHPPWVIKMRRALGLHDAGASAK